MDSKRRSTSDVNTDMDGEVTNNSNRIERVPTLNQHVVIQASKTNTKKIQINENILKGKNTSMINREDKLFE